MYKNKFTIGLLIMVISFSFVVVGCSGGQKQQETVGQKQQETVEITFGHEFGNDTPQQEAILKYKEQVENESNGSLIVNVFPSGQMGNARELFEGLQVGSINVSAIPTARISGFVPQLQIFDIPFLFGDEEGRSKVLDGDIGETLLGTLEDQKVIGITFYDDGFKQMTANKPLKSLEDFKGLKFRTMESPIIMEQYKSLGANPVPIEYAELYNSLQLNVVDGQENPIIHIYSNKYYEVQKYLMITNHAPLSGVLLYGEEWFNGLSEDSQDILEKAGKDFSYNLKIGIQEKEETYVQDMEEKGMEVIHLTKDELDVFKEATLPVHEIYIKEFGNEIINKIYEELK